MLYKYYPKGVCAREFIFDIENDVIKEAKIIGGCQGNTAGICSLIKGMKVIDVISKLKGIVCGMRGTSCPDQISKALEKYMSEKE